MYYVQFSRILSALVYCLQLVTQVVTTCKRKKTYFRKRIEMFLIRKRFLRVTISETFAKVLTAIDIPWLNRV